MTRASRDHAWRRQAARLIATAMGDAGLGRWLADQRDPVEFDVARVRAYCERLIAEADALDAQREVFSDWTRDRGLGPENREPGAFILLHPAWYETSPDMWPDGSRGGWPGNLAREFVSDQRKRRRCSRRDCDGGRVGECDDCLGHGFKTRYVSEASLAGVEVPGPGFSDGVRTECDACEGTGRNRCYECNPIKVIGVRERRPSRAFANGGNMRRAAQRLLDTLYGRCPWNPDAEAQPSECGCVPADVQHSVTMRTDGGHEMVIEPGRLRIDRGGCVCTRCNGTGHNLRGALPPLPHETDRKRTSKAVRFSRPWRGTMAEISAALHGVPNIGNVTVGERDVGLTIRWFGTATEAAVRRALEPVLPAAVGLELVPPDRR